jgi:hypothetical protein
MKLKNRLRQSLQEKAIEVIPPRELKQKVMNKIELTQGVNPIKKRLIAGLIATCLIIPTSAFAYQAYMADDLYGSFKHVKKHISSVTSESYLLLSAKLSQAKGELGEEQYEHFKIQLKVITSAKIEYGDQYGNIDYDLVPQEVLAQIKDAIMEIQPYIDQLNNRESSKEILSAEEYNLYIDALMTHEKVLVKSGINPSKSYQIDQIHSDMQKEFLLAKEMIEDVDKKTSKPNESVLPIPTFSLNGENVHFEYGLPALSTKNTESIDGKDIGLYLAYADLLKPLIVGSNSTLDVTFDKQPDKVNFQFLNEDGSILSGGSIDEFTFPNESGKYVVTVVGEWDKMAVPYVFVTVVE